MPMQDISFSIKPKDGALVGDIVDRAVECGLIKHKERLHLRMDLVACHANGCPMDFERLLAADDFNFIHDVSGIRSHMDRDTGRLQNLFRPRHAKRED